MVGQKIFIIYDKYNGKPLNLKIFKRGNNRERAR